MFACLIGRVEYAARVTALPSFVGPYEVLAKLGEGGMGIVYRARATGAGSSEEVALKVVRATCTDEDALARFDREAGIRVDHPNIVRVVDRGHTADGPYIAFELLEGETLGERLSRGRLSREEAFDVLIQAARGLVAAHDAGVVHRDLKPSNLFLCSDGTVKILDFGVALLESIGTRLTASHQVVGTLAYLSPEQVESEESVDHRCDIWALGAVFYECLAGRVPFLEDSAIGTLVAIMMAQPPPVSAFIGTTDATIENIIARTLDKRRGARFSDARALLRALEESLGGVEVVSIPSTLRPDEQRAVVLVYAFGVDRREEVERVIRKHGGTPVGLPEKRTLGLFGDEGGARDQVARGLAAAIEMRSSVARVAVSTGRAMGSASGITGSALDAAVRALEFEVEGIAISSDAARQVGELKHLMVTRTRGCVEVPADRALLQTLLLEPSPAALVGREMELAQIRRLMETVADESSAELVWIVGPPGIGKSRLALESSKEMVRIVPGARCQTARVDGVHAGRSLSLWLALARAAAEDTGAGTASAAEHLASWAFGAGTEDHVRLSLALRALLASDSSVALVAPRLDAPTEIQMVDDQLRVAITDWLLGAARKRPLLLVFEDLHRSDRQSLELLEDLVERAHDIPLMVLATARPEFDDHYGSIARANPSTTIRLRGLGAAASRELASAFATQPLTADLLEEIVERSEGNPFFIEHFVRALQEGAGGEELPVSVETAVQSRLDALPPGERELCKVAAVFGGPFSLAHLAATAEVRPEVGARSLRTRGLWAARGQQRVDFASVLVRDVAYRLLADDRRAELHERAARTLDASGSDPEEIGRHLEAAGLGAEAATFYAQAAEARAAQGDAETALRASSAAIRLVPDMGKRFGLRIARAEALRFRGSRDEQLDELRMALATTSNLQERAWALSERCVCLSRNGDLEGALEAGEEAVDAAGRANRVSLLAVALGRLLLAQLAGGDLAGARESFTRMSRAAGDTRDPRIQALAAEWEGQLAAAEGDLSTRLHAFGEGARLHRESGDLRRAAGADANRADGFNRVGAYSRAEQALRESLDACQRVGHRAMEGYVRLNLAYALLQVGRCVEADEQLAATREIAERIGETRLSILAKIYSAKSALSGGEPQRAHSAALDAETSAVARGFTSLEVGALVELSRAQLAMGSADEALITSTRALRTLERLGGVEEDELLVYLTHALACEACGHRAEADATTRRAMMRLRELSSVIADDGLRQAFLEQVPAHRALRERAAMLEDAGHVLS